MGCLGGYLVEPLVDDDALLSAVFGVVLVGLGEVVHTLMEKKCLAAKSAKLFLPL